MSNELLTSLAIFALAILVGFEVISKVPATLHTPLMSGANSIHGEVNWPSTVAFHASQLYSRNVSALLAHLSKDGALALDLEDEITKGALITYDGQVVHAATKAALEKA